METYKVYVRADDAGRVTAVNSDAFLTDVTGWTLIDEGGGDRYLHAQGNYLPGPLMDGRGLCRYKLEGGAAVERTQEEMDADWTPPMPAVSDEALALVELAAMVAEQQAAIVELAAMLEEGRKS